MKNKTTGLHSRQYGSETLKCDKQMNPTGIGRVKVEMELQIAKQANMPIFVKINVDFEHSPV